MLVDSGAGLVACDGGPPVFYRSRHTASDVTAAIFTLIQQVMLRSRQFLEDGFEPDHDAFREN